MRNLDRYVWFQWKVHCTLKLYYKINTHKKHLVSDIRWRSEMDVVKVLCIRSKTFTHIAVKMREILRSFIACHSQLGLIGPLFGFYHTSLKWIEPGRDMKTGSSSCCISLAYTLLMPPFTFLHNLPRKNSLNEAVSLSFKFINFLYIVSVKR